MAPIPTSVKYVFWSFKTQQLKYMKEQAKETKNGHTRTDSAYF